MIFTWVTHLEGWRGGSMIQLLMTHKPSSSPIARSALASISIGIIVRNEEQAIRPMLASLFRQNLFAELGARGWAAEILCIANACTDRTAEIAEAILGEQTKTHPDSAAFSARVISLSRPGKLSAWNQFVHRFSAREAECLFLMDGDIVLHYPETLWNMYRALESDATANVATDEPLKDISLKRRKSVKERMSLATSRMAKNRPAQLSGQLYCIRSEVARNIYLPRDLSACEDGFIKALVCTDFLTRELATNRITRAADASHIFEAYTRWRDIIRNQKRQMIGQTIVHILIDDYLRTLRIEERLKLAETLQDKDRLDPEWLRRLIVAHIQRTRWFWKLFPDALGYPFRRLKGIPGARKLHFPSALAGFGVTVISCWMAYRMLKRGYTNYWPDTQSPRLRVLAERPGPAAHVCDLTPQ